MWVHFWLHVIKIKIAVGRKCRQAANSQLGEQQGVSPNYGSSFQPFQM